MEILVYPENRSHLLNMYGHWAFLLISVPLLLKVNIWLLHPKEKKGQSTDTFLFSFREKQVEPMKLVRIL